MNKSAKKDMYASKLIPRLAKYAPGRWIQIADIANDVSDFIETVQQLVNEGLFLDECGYCIIEVKNDSFVRIDPDYHRRISGKFSIWKRP